MGSIATHDLFPQPKIFMTQCSGGDLATNFNDNLIWDMDNIFIGGCTNCRGLLTINTETNQVNYNEYFYSTASMSKFIQNVATRIGGYC